jgi:hypothetical protein
VCSGSCNVFRKWEFRRLPILDAAELSGVLPGRVRFG